MALNIEKFAQEAHQFLNQLAEETGRDKGYASRLLQSTLHILRGHISSEESLHFIAQLPLFLKGLYVEGWNMNEDLDRIKTFDEYVEQIMEEGSRVPGNELGAKENVKKDVLIVFRLLDQYVSKGEWKDVGANMPPAIREAILEVVE